MAEANGREGPCTNAGRIRSRSTAHQCAVPHLLVGCQRSGAGGRLQISLGNGGRLAASAARGALAALL